MKIVEFKIWPQFHEEVRAGTKPFEVRDDLKGAERGDIMWLREWCPETKQYTGKESRHKIGFILNMPEFYVIAHDTNSPAEFIDLGPAEIKAGRIAQTFGQQENP